jgi:hypothetical protein
MPGHEPQPAGLGPHAEQDLATARVSNSASVSSGGRPVRTAPEMIVDLDVECGQKGVQVGPHKLILNTLRPSSDTNHTQGLFV